MQHPVPGYGRRREALLIFFVGLLLFSIGLGEREFLGFESRFGLFAREMLQDGVTPFPTVYGAPYPDYPATQTLLVYLLSLLYGKLTIFTAVLPSAVCAALTLSLTYLSGSLYTRSWGIHAVILELGTVGFVAEARTISLDHIVTACTAFTAYMACSRSLRNLPPAWLLLALGLAMGFAVRGPLGLVIPAAVLLACFIALGEFRRLGPAILLAALLLAAGIAILLFTAWREGGEGFVQRLIAFQFTGRLASEKPSPWYFYLTAGLYTYAVSFPMALSVIVLRARSFETAELKLFFAGTAWFLVVLGLLSIPAAKKSRYLLPAVPAMALLAASVFPGGVMDGKLDWLRRIVVKLFIGIPPVGLIAFLIAPLLARRLDLDLARLQTQGLVLLSLATLASIGLAVSKTAPPWRQTALLAGGVAALVTVQVFIVEPVQLALETTRPFVERVERLRGEGQALVFYKIGPDTDDVKYVVNMEVPTHPVFASTPADLVTDDKAAVFIAGKRDFETLPTEVADRFAVIATGKLGRRQCVAFRRR